VEVIVDRTYRVTEEMGMEVSYIVLNVNVTNNGIISHYVYLTESIALSSQPDMVFIETSRVSPIDPGATWQGVRIYVDVPDETIQDPYEASCSITLPPLSNEYNMGFIVPATVVWLEGLAALSTSLVRSRRK